MNKPWYKRWILYLLVGLVALLIVVVVVGVAVDNAYGKTANNVPSFSVPPPKVFTVYDIEIGMTTREVREICGWPDDESTYRSEYGIFDTYTYKKPSGKYIMVDF